MSKGRLEAFSDGVLAIIITIVILMFDISEAKRLRQKHQIRLPLKSLVGVKRKATPLR